MTKFNPHLNSYNLCLTDCGFALVPETETSKFRLAASITHQNGNRLEQFEILDIDNSTLTNASVIAVNNTDQLISSSVCHITSLEVYRGRRQITEISHDGFSLSERGQVQVNQSHVIYLSRVSSFNYFFNCRLIRLSYLMTFLSTKENYFAWPSPALV